MNIFFITEITLKSISIDLMQRIAYFFNKIYSSIYIIQIDPDLITLKYILIKCFVAFLLKFYKIHFKWYIPNFLYR